MMVGLDTHAVSQSLSERLGYMRTSIVCLTPTSSRNIALLNMATSSLDYDDNLFHIKFGLTNLLIPFLRFDLHSSEYLNFDVLLFSFSFIRYSYF